MTRSALTIQTEGRGPIALISMDHGWWRSHCESEALSKAIEAEGIVPDNAIIALSHTHAGPNFSPVESKFPGGKSVKPYLELLCHALQGFIQDALQNAFSGVIETDVGQSSLVTNRDLPDPDEERLLVGWNPSGTADQTVLVGRIADMEGLIRATVVNYACPPSHLWLLSGSSRKT